MAVAAKYTRFLLDEFDFSGDSNKLTVASTVAVLRNTGFQAEAETSQAGLTEASIAQEGYYTGKGAGFIEQEINARLGTATAVYLAALFGTNIAACPAYVTTRTWGQQLTINMPVAELITLSSNWPCSGELLRGLRLTSVATQTISGIGALASVDFGAQGTAGGFGYVFTQVLTGGASPVIDIESSATEGGSYVSEGTATPAAVGVTVVPLTGTVDRWVRLNVTSMGTTSSFVIVGIVALSGVSY